jgi:hypothetical protein
MLAVRYVALPHVWSKTLACAEQLMSVNRLYRQVLGLFNPDTCTSLTGQVLLYNGSVAAT